MLKQVHVYIYGDVIGVGFRAWTVIQAKELGIKGWVRNNYEKNCVEALLQAEEDKIREMITRLNEGPDVSKVEKVEVIWEKSSELFEKFSIT